MHFPEIKTTRDSKRQAEKVIEEIYEVLAALEEGNNQLIDMEIVDVLQCAETLIHVHFRGRMDEFESMKEGVRKKNDARGYYTKGCY